MKKIKKYVYVLILSYIAALKSTLLIFYEKSKADEEKEYLNDVGYCVEMYKIPIK